MDLDVEQHSCLLLPSLEIPGLLKREMLLWERHRFIAFNWCSPLISKVLLALDRVDFSVLCILCTLESVTKRKKTGAFEVVERYFWDDAAPQYPTSYVPLCSRSHELLSHSGVLYALFSTREALGVEGKEKRFYSNQEAPAVSC